MKFSIVGIAIISLLLFGCVPSKMVSLGYKTKFVPISQNTPQTKVSKVETSNQQYQYFLDATHQSKFKPDTTAWQKLGGYVDAMAKNYHQHPAFKDYPVVNITHEAATAYCAWLTAQYDAKSPKEKVTFRLPTRQELQPLITARKDLLTGEFDKDCSCDFPANLKYRNATNDSIDYVMDGELFAGKAKKHKQKGLYSILGNVSEICLDGSVIGGNWDSFAKDIERKLDYSYPDSRIGFRVVMVIE